MNEQTTARTYTISQVSRLTGLPASTLRYYESIGLIGPIHRDTISKQRVYDEKNLNLIVTTACLNATGMSIEDMKTYIQNAKEVPEAGVVQIDILKKQQRHLAKELKLLKLRQRYVALKVEYWKAVEAGDHTLVEEISSEAGKLAHALIEPSRYSV